MKKILGLDLGVTSIGWALINEEENKKEILGMGSRIIPLSTDEKDEFSSGNKISKNQKRTAKRTQRKGYDRYQLRRKSLTNELLKNNMFDENLFKLNSLELWGIRARAVTERIELKELGRILYHLNQKRGYKSSRSDANMDKKDNDSDYVAKVKGRHQQIKEKGITIGQHFHFELQNNQYYRTKEQVYPREAYIEEFDAIINQQRKHHPTILTEGLIFRLRNEIIYYQRNLKSQKGLVSVCEFEGFWTKTKEGKDIYAGPRVAPKTSPLFQLCKIWEAVNNINLKIKNPEGSKYKWSDRIPSQEEKQKIADHLFQNAGLSFNELLKILGLKKDAVYANKQILKGIQGNITYSEIHKIIGNSDHFKFNLFVIPSKHSSILVDTSTGEIIEEKESLQIDAKIEQEPFYQLWHIIYSIKDTIECKNALLKRFGFKEETAEKLAQLDFNKQAFGNKSNKAMRKTLPYLMQGYNYSQSCSFAGYNHSNSLSKEEQAAQKTEDKLQLLDKNSLRQPVVEKILNQMINLVNALIEKHGKPDEIRIELARELKQSKDERNDADKYNSANKKLNEEITKRLKELGLPTTKKVIQKYKFVFAAKNAQVVNQCIYCGETFNLTEALSGDNFDVDHIVPKALLFDDSQTNKVLVHRSCNAKKTNQTAYDYISKKGELELQNYIDRVDDWFKLGIISYSKMQRLKVSYEEYTERKKQKKETETDKKLWENFIDRQLRETQYIARKSKEILQTICNSVTTTEGTVTAKLRKLWGWDDVLMNLQLPKYKELGQTKIREWSSEHGKRTHKKEEIINWTKRDDHRHHAIDALVVACTKQGFIQRINTLNASDVRDEMKKTVDHAKQEFEERLSLLEKYLITQTPFSTKEVEDEASKILVSFKSGKKVATYGVRKVKQNGKKQVVQQGIVIPRGPLSEESVYGKIKTIEKNKPIKYLFENPNLIFKGYIKDFVLNRLSLHNNDSKKAIASLKKDPIYLDDEKTKVLQFGTCYKEEYVIKYPIGSIKAKDTEYIIDEKVKELIQERLKEHNNKEKEAFKTPLYYDKEYKMPIKSVRMFTGLSSVEPVSKNEKGENIGFVKPGNNHHIAFYINENGEKVEHCCTFWHAVERKKYNIPAIIKDPKEVWDKILLNKDTYPQNLLEKLPNDKWAYHESLQQNEIFILGLEKELLSKALEEKDKNTLSKYLYRVQKLTIVNSSINIWFRHHLETQINDSNEAKTSKRFYNVQSIGAFEKLNPTKIRINTIGEIKI
ncbi:MAG: type II CRISPR RNA-guided endonuclease Cas9 [Bacteroidetes bacterium]|nr:type II CRISPR RNA-guided endonuclease Cas9 [Bacteroidota bacterium]